MWWLHLGVCIFLLLIVYAQDYGKCGEQGSPVHGKTKVILHRSSGILVEYICEPGYQRVGPHYSVCIKGVWTTSLPACVRTSSREVNDGAAQDQSVLISLEELPSTQRSVSSKHVIKNRQRSRKKKKRKRKGKGIASLNIAGNYADVKPNLDMSCLLNPNEDIPTFVRPPQVPNSLGPKFVRRKTDKLKYLVAIYRCAPGFKLHNPHSRSLGCQNGKWIGRLPICLSKRKKNGCLNAGCEHDCRVIDGKPKCFCFKGFRQSAKTCLDINECSIDNGGCKSTCHNTPGSFFCGCHPGYRLASDLSSCIDVNECLARNGHGPCQGHCENLKGSYHCSCEGMPGTRLARDGISCEDINECSDPEHLLDCSHACINTLGSAFCLCPTGYELGLDWKKCQDIDECAQNMTYCSHGCSNNPGSFTCTCPLGFVVNSGGSECVDVDECLEFGDKYLCSHSCQNSIGSYKCLCPFDYELSSDHRTCHLKENNCQKKNCSQDCKIENEEAFCVCDEGCILKDSLTCVDINECEEEKAGCSHGCINEEGSFQCTCPEGFLLLPDQRTCGEKQCNIGNLSNGCHNNSIFTFKCPEGYKNVDSNCVDINECDFRISLCSQLCKNTIGSYECHCNEGFYLSDDNKSCTDINECEQMNLCSYSLCINTEGSYLCECPIGYTSDNNTKECKDINECTFVVDEGSSICSHYCTNSLGSFQCECPPGFTLGKDSRTCEDIDECLENNEINMKCSHNCVNELGSYHCECPQGYLLTDTNNSCLESRRCQINNGGCSHICIENGSYAICECPEKYILDNDSLTCLVSQCSENNGGCSQVCDDSSGICSCYEGFTLQEDSSQCVDVNECLINNGHCSQQCINTNGSYYCTCYSGYQMDSRSQVCSDINECIEHNAICDQVCVNSEGSYKCHCFDGYILSNDGIQCLIIDNSVEEEEYNHRCKPGFILSSDNITCVDIDECFLNTSGCSQICNSSYGGVSCGCKPGFKLQNKLLCIEDVNVTKQHQEMCEHDYILTEGKPRCCCRSGFVLVNTTQCVAINDCRTVHGCDPTSASLNVCLTEEVVSNYTVTTNESSKKGCELLPVDNGTAKIDCGPALERYPQGTECYVSCRAGYKLTGPKIRICLNNGTWSGQDVYCKEQIRPYIRCIPHIRLTLPTGKSVMTAKIPQPRSNMDWEKYVSSNPPWGKQLQGALSYGTTLLQFMATSPSSSYVAKCNISIYVKDAEKPTINYCPDDINLTLRSGQKSMSVTWKEPTITDNIQVAHIFQSQRPGVTLSEGVHPVNYIAADMSGNIANCQFTITVVGSSEAENEP